MQIGNKNPRIGQTFRLETILKAKFKFYFPIFLQFCTVQKLHQWLLLSDLLLHAGYYPLLLLLLLLLFSLVVVVHTIYLATIVSLTPQLQKVVEETAKV